MEGTDPTRISHHEIDEEVPTEVALFVACSDDATFPESAKATVELLERLGVDVGGPCGLVRMPPGASRR